MNIRDRKIYYALMTLIGLMGILTSCHREEIPNDPQQSQTPISFTPTSDWPTLTKAIYEDVTHLNGDGIVVWADLESTPVFGDNGTKAYYPDWSYSPAKYWTPSEHGYNFAAVLPASIFNASHPEEDEIFGITGEFSDGELTLNFGDDGFDLNDNKQTDLMVAFAHQDYTSSDFTNGLTPGAVNFSFNHQLVQLKFQIKNLIEIGNTEITPSICLTKFSVSGFHSVVKSAVFTESSAEWTPRNETEGDTCEYTGNPVIIDNGSSELIISSILAIPETSCNLTVSVEHTEVLGDNSIEYQSQSKSATISGGPWEAGKTYVYPLKITKSGIIFLDPTVTDWQPGGEVGNIEFK